jgi:hypothetical protein
MSEFGRVLVEFEQNLELILELILHFFLCSVYDIFLNFSTSELNCKNAARPLINSNGEVLRASVNG